MVVRSRREPTIGLLVHFAETVHHWRIRMVSRRINLQGSMHQSPALTGQSFGIVLFHLLDVVRVDRHHLHGLLSHMPLESID
jgi:hypothetical protein